MRANYEKRKFRGKENIWLGRYHNLNNLPHWHLECELIYVESGEIVVSHNNQNYTLSEQDAIFLGSGEIHFIRSESESIVSIFMFDPKIIRGLTDHFHLTCAKLEHHYPITSVFQQINAELQEQQPFFELLCQELLLKLFIEIFRGEAISSNIPQNADSTINRYKKLLDEINEKYSYITFEDAAVFMGFSKPYFSKYFRKISGMTFSQYLNSVRLEHAISRITRHREGRSITEIASECGFETIRHFNRVCKELTGMSPRQLPENYILNTHPILKIEDAFNPTLQNSELL